MPRLLLSLVALVALTPRAPAAPPDFDKQIAPLLASRCLDCHSGAKPKGKLDLSSKVGASAAVMPGKPASSPLWERVAAGEMPPKKPLPDAEQKLLKEWIESGAKWGSDPIDPFRFTTATRAGYDWWALQPVTRPKVPETLNTKNQTRNTLDKFVIAKLSDKGLSLSPEAGRRTLIRRVHFDLIGLPPTPEEVNAFVASTDADAYEKVVERLLASPHYGERWARHWLDVVRYGETDGFERNSPRPNAFHYRDWVIRALNADMPYDRFARLQLAGDVLHPDDPDAVKATGFLVAGVHNTVLGNDQMRAVARQDELEDIVGGVAQTFLGLTANCARCHDHKFDPVSQTDFYRLASALGGVGFGERALPDAKAAIEIAKFAKELDAVVKELAALEGPVRKAVLADKGMGKLDKLAPSPVAAWDFRKGADDLIGKLHAKPVGEAKPTPHGVAFDGKTGLMRTDPLSFGLKVKTIEAWVKLDDLTQRGGGIISLQTPNGAEFDAIVFGENEPGRWMAGSNGFVRYKSFSGTEEKDAAKDFVHFAVTFSDDGTITGYRNGEPYGKGYASKGPVAFAAEKAVVVFGCRHEPAGGNKMLAGTVSMARLYDKALSPDEVRASFASGGGFASDAEIDAKLTPDQRSMRSALRKRHDALALQLGALRQRATGAKAYANVPLPPGVTRFLARGDVTTPGAVVAPAGLAAMTGPKADFALKPDAPDGERRKKLAEWITAPNNPLFARVIANRVWHYHFGTGIVETPNDFGFNGGRPSHPELLDWLAAEFIERKYSLKSLHKLLVLSATYRQQSAPRKDASAKDAANRLLWRYKPHRLEGEAVRDVMLAVSGLLNPEVGGKGFSDYKIRDFNGTAYFDPFDPVGPEFHRRSVYRFTPRGANQGLLDAFDCPDPAAAAPRRAVTTTPLQALSLWNNGFALRAADAFAARVAEDAEGAEGAAKQVRRAWQFAYQRDPTADETKLATKLVADHGLKALCRVLFNSNEFVTVEQLMRLDRRDLLLSASALGATTALHLLAGAKPHHAPKAKRAIQISLVGGMSHIDSFDHKPELTKRHGKPLGSDTKPDVFFGQVGLLRKPDWEFKRRGKSGLWVSELFPHIAGVADELTVVNSMTADSANHTPALFVLNSGFQFNGYPALGSWLSYGLGSEADDLPAFVVLPDGRGEANGAASNWSSGFLPAQHQGVVFRGGDSPVRDLFPEKAIPAAEEKDSRAALEKLNSMHLERSGKEGSLAARMQSYALAAKMQLAVPAVADLSKETTRLKTQYGLDDEKTADCGRRCLLARRLLERGVRFVQIYSGGPIAGKPRTSWDAHEDVKENHGAEAARIDQPIAALVQDLKQRDMLKDTLMIFTTEFGRTPFAQSAGNVVGAGRDHNKYGFSCWLAGAGLKPGFAFGATDDIGWKVTEHPVAWHDFHATVLHLLGIDHEKLTYYHNGIQRRLTNVHGEVVKELIK